MEILEGRPGGGSAEELIMEVFEIWDTFHDSNQSRGCPGCDWPNKTHTPHCWFGRAGNFLRSRNVSIPEVG